MRARSNISLKNRYTATLGGFKGVDLNTSPLRVERERASSMKNFICDNGINHKRPGWEQWFRMADENGAAFAVHGVFPFDENGTEILLVHAGTGIYRAVRSPDGKWVTTRLDDGSLGISEERSQCFYRGGRAFIAGCGNYLVYGEFDGEYALKEVAEIAYVPTTTIGIGGSAEVQETLDAVNLLTRKRINKLIGRKIVENENSSSADNNGNYELALDGEAAPASIKIEIEGQSWVTHKTGTFYTSTCIPYAATLEGMANGKLILKELSSADYVTGGNTGASQYGVNSEAGSIRMADDGNTRIKLYFGAEPQSDPGAGNIKVTYDAVVGDDYDESRIQDCRFGVLFGANGADDRLFLAGNGKYKNMDFWSEWNDFTYFPDGNTMEVGGAHSAITAYARLSDTTLAVLKEEKAGEPTIFYRTSRERTEEDGIVLKQWFPVSAGIAGDGTVNPHAVATLAGDVLTLTRNGVHALVLSANVASGERYTRERSRPIYRELSSAKLSDAAGIVYRNRYYLSLPDTGKCYVADAHYKAIFEGTTDYNYEWWIWENVPATCFAEYADKLIFGTPEGLVCAFTEGSFTDRTYTEVKGGNMLAREDGAITYSITTPPDDYERVVLEGNVYARSEDGTLESLSGVELYVKEVNTAQWFTVARDPALQHPLFICTDGEASSWTGRFIHVTPVEAEWITPIMDFGTNAQSKTLLQLTVATEPGIEGNVTFGYETRRMLRQMHADRALAVPVEQNAVEIGGDKGFSFDDIDFNNFSFDTAFACSYTKRMCLRNFNFIQFKFGSNTDEDCAVSGVTLIYKINQNYRGVR